MSITRLCFFSGEELSIADFSLLASVTHLEAVCYGYQAYPSVHRWSEKLKATLPYYKDCNEEGINMMKEWITMKNPGIKTQRSGSRQNSLPRIVYQ